MKKLIVLVLALICMIGLVGCGNDSTDGEKQDNANQDGVHEAIPDLSMATLKSLVDIYKNNGNEMSWETFAPYYYSEETGTDKYIRRYSVDTDYFLIIEGSSVEKTPTYMKLVLRNDSNKYIDIRYENIDNFINAD